jgi:hypothetical protein
MGRNLTPNWRQTGTPGSARRCTLDIPVSKNFEDFLNGVLPFLAPFFSFSGFFQFLTPFSQRRAGIGKNSQVPLSQAKLGIGRNF